MNPKQSLETAAYNFLNNLPTPLALVTNIYKGVQNDTATAEGEGNEQPNYREMPCVTVIAEGDHQEVVMNTGNFRGILAIAVESVVAGTTDGEFKAMADEVFSAFNISDLADAMGEYTEDFTVTMARLIDVGSTIKGASNWEHVMRFDVVYAEADL